MTAAPATLVGMTILQFHWLEWVFSLPIWCVCAVGVVVAIRRRSVLLALGFMLAALHTAGFTSVWIFAISRWVPPALIAMGVLRCSRQ